MDGSNAHSPDELSLETLRRRLRYEPLPSEEQQRYMDSIRAKLHYDPNYYTNLLGERRTVCCNELTCTCGELRD